MFRSSTIELIALEPFNEEPPSQELAVITFSVPTLATRGHCGPSGHRLSRQSPAWVVTARCLAHTCVHWLHKACSHQWAFW